jgi:PPOX class probable F420-dependent enzyme
MTSIPASHHDLIEKNPTLALATIGASGFPPVTATWSLADDAGTIRLSLNTARQKTKNLQRNPECAVFFYDPANPYRTLEIRGRAAIEPDPDYALADQVGAKYGGADLREQDQPGETRVSVTITPVKANTFG